MKYLLILAGFLAVCCGSNVNRDFVKKLVEKIRRVSEECIAQSHASREAIQILLEHKIPESHEGKCMVFCFHKHFNIQNEDGSLNTEGTLAGLEPLKRHNQELYNQVANIFTTCADSVPVDSDPCVYASLLAECAIHEGESMSLADELLIID